MSHASFQDTYLVVFDFSILLLCEQSREGSSADNTVEVNSLKSECTGYHQQGHAGSRLQSSSYLGVPANTGCPI